MKDVSDDLRLPAETMNDDRILWLIAGILVVIAWTLLDIKYAIPPLRP
jgi:hypothetical protein